MELFETDIGAVCARLESVAGKVAACHHASVLNDDEAPSTMDDVARQLSDVVGRIEAKATGSAGIDAAGISEVGEYALGLVEDLLARARHFSLDDEERHLKELVPALALWIARRGGTLSRLEMVVDALADAANRMHDPDDLARLCEQMGEILDALPEDVRADTDKSNPGRPWRVLNLNRGIVATRTHDPEIMRDALTTLTENLPEDAAEFFEQGMEQMDAIGYPLEIRQVMESFYNEWHPDNVH